MTDVDVLMLAHDRADYLSLSLPRLLETLPAGARLWVWQNEQRPEVSQILSQYRDHPRFHKQHVSPTNVGIKEPTRWFWREAQGDLLGKVDDDCLVPPEWVETFVKAHEDAAELGIVACWHFQPEDLLPDSVKTRGLSLPGGHTILRNCWVGGSGYLMKRQCLLSVTEDLERSWTGNCIDIASDGWHIGWYYPLLIQDHMDDPRSPNTSLRTDQDLLDRMPLSTARLQEVSLRAWQQQLEDSAVTVQTASLRPKDHRGWRPRARRLAVKVANSLKPQRH